MKSQSTLTTIDIRVVYFLDAITELFFSLIQVCYDKDRGFIIHVQFRQLNGKWFHLRDESSIAVCAFI
jgi:hypothetical protein